MERFTIYLEMPPYLAQWYADDCLRYEYKNEDYKPQGVYKFPEVVVPIRGSQESKILEYFLQKQPCAVPELGVPEGATLALGIPCYKYKNPLYFNYLGKNAKKMLVQTIRDRFAIELWQELHTFENVLSRQDNAIFSFMEAHGIECTETNWNALAKIYQRSKDAYQKHLIRGKRS